MAFERVSPVYNNNNGIYLALNEHLNKSLMYFSQFLIGVKVKSANNRRINNKSYLISFSQIMLSVYKS